MSTAEPVAIINDDEEYQQNWSVQVEDAGFRPVVISRPSTHPFQNVSDLITIVEQSARWAVCDHRLSDKDFASFTGAELTAELNQRKHTPALLVTTYGKIDAGVSIRRFR